MACSRHGFRYCTCKMVLLSPPSTHSPSMSSPFPGRQTRSAFPFPIPFRISSDSPTPNPRNPRNPQISPLLPAPVATRCGGAMQAVIKAVCALRRVILVAAAAMPTCLCAHSWQSGMARGTMRPEQRGVDVVVMVADAMSCSCRFSHVESAHSFPYPCATSTPPSPSSSCAPSRP